jgi:filamentous hemagglutinin
VYTSTDAAGKVVYVGITNNVERRAAEHLATKGFDIDVIPGLETLSRSDAKAVEQVLIEAYGGPNGGQLANEINSIAVSNPIYAVSKVRGCMLLGSVNFPLPGSVCP